MQAKDIELCLIRLDRAGADDGAKGRGIEVDESLPFAHAIITTKDIELCLMTAKGEENGRVRYGGSLRLRPGGERGVFGIAPGHIEI